jgi:mRNA interferase MazF
VIIAPMTTQGRSYLTRVACKFQGKQGQIVLDQIRTIDKSRLIRKLGRIDSQTQMKVLSVLHDMLPNHLPDCIKIQFSKMSFNKTNGLHS